MAISDRIEAIEQHLEDDYSVLEVAGADLTNVNKNIINLKPTWQERLLYFINNGTEEVYNNWDKATGEGTEISLNNTLEAKMGIIYKGNTYQYSTTGKNLLPNNATTQTINGVTFTANEDKTIKVNGTASARTVYYLANNINVTIQAGTYTLSSDKTDTGSSIEALVNVNGSNQYWNSYISPTTKTISQSGVIKAVYIIVENGTTVNTLYKPQLEVGSSMTSYEPYTGGIASPNPDYPQEIQVVSGDNTIKVEGKNLVVPFEYTRTNNGITFTYSLDGSINLNNTSTGTAYAIANADVPIYTRLEAGTYTLSGGTANIPIRFDDKTGTNIISTTSSSQFTLNQTTEGYIQIRVGSGKTFANEKVYPMIEKGSTATTYEPYQSASYPIYLGVENLWNRDKLKTGFLPTSGAYPTTNSTYPDAKYLTFELSQGNSFIIANSSDSDSDIRVRYIDKTTNQVVGTVTTSTNNYYTSTVNLDSGFANGTVTAKQDIIIGIMILRPYHTSVTADVTYGTHLQYISDTPIELCKIGEYQDRIFKSSGKNLISTSQYDTNDYISQRLYLEAKTYNVSYTGDNSTGIYVRKDDGTTPINGTSVATRYNGTSLSFTLTDSGYYYIQFYKSGGYTTFTNPMLNEGSTALPYEPYGTGWYLNKQIDKVVLDGTETINMKTSGFFGVVTPQASIYATNLELKPILCNRLINDTRDNVYNGAIGISYSNSSSYYNNICLRVSSDVTTIANFRTWLQDNETIVYYALLNPTYTEIEGTLKEQLETIKTSYEGQTNISQENNDLASVLNASALQEM